MSFHHWRLLSLKYEIMLYQSQISAWGQNNFLWHLLSDLIFLNSSSVTAVFLYWFSLWFISAVKTSRDATNWFLLDMNLFPLCQQNTLHQLLETYTGWTGLNKPSYCWLILKIHCWRVSTHQPSNYKTANDTQCNVHVLHYVALWVHSCDCLILKYKVLWSVQLIF